MRKMKVATVILIALLAGSTAFGQTKTEKFKVYGNCGMCESRIEKAASDVEGVTDADWDKETKMLEVSFDESKSDIHKIHMAVAGAGHDTGMHRAEDEVYNELPGCCKYERPEEEGPDDHPNDHAH